MTISVIQAILIGLLYYLGINGTPWTTLLGSTILQKPLVSGVLVGCILGDPVQGAIIGAAIQLPFIAYISAGGAPPTDPGLAGTLGTALAMAAGVKPEAAIAMAVPIGLLGTIIWVLHMTIDVFFVHMIDKAADEGNMKKAEFLHIVPPQIAAPTTHRMITPSHSVPHSQCKSYTNALHFTLISNPNRFLLPFPMNPLL